MLKSRLFGLIGTANMVIVIILANIMFWLSNFEEVPVWPETLTGIGIALFFCGAITMFIISFLIKEDQIG